MSLADSDPDLAVAVAASDFDSAIKLVRGRLERLGGDALRDPVTSDWLGRRYRWLFVRSVEQDEAGMEAARRVRGVRMATMTVDRQRIFERFFVGVDSLEAKADQPDAALEGVGDVTLVFCPGLLTGLLPVFALQPDLALLAATTPVPVRIVDSHPVRSSQANAADLLDVLDNGLGLQADGSALVGGQADPVADVVILGYSKGVPDALEVLVQRPDLAARCRALVSLAGVVGGSMHADNVLRRIDVQDRRRLIWDPAAAELLTRVSPVVRLDRLPRRLEQYDLLGALRSLSTAERTSFLHEHADDLVRTRIPLFSIAAATRFFEVPYFQASSYLALARADPLNDTQLTLEQATFPLPTATHLGTHHAHHWDLVYPPFPRATRLSSPHLDHAFPSRCALKAVVLLLNELGLL